jgi:hypothetical protein
MTTFSVIHTEQITRQIPLILRWVLLPVKVDLDDVHGWQVHEPEPQARHQAHAAAMSYLKEQCHEIFDFRFFYMDQFPPSP